MNTFYREIFSLKRWVALILANIYRFEQKSFLERGLVGHMIVGELGTRWVSIIYRSGGGLRTCLNRTNNWLFKT